jgi:hypothetical protein
LAANFASPGEKNSRGLTYKLFLPLEREKVTRIDFYDEVNAARVH